MSAGDPNRTEGWASDFIGGAGKAGRRGKVGRTLRSGSPVSQDTTPSGNEAPKPKTKTVRYTVDLDPELHRVLKLCALDAQIKGAEVVRALLEELRDNPELVETMLDRMRS